MSELSGIELRAAVAREVMGWVHVDPASACWIAPAGGMACTASSIPAYESDIAAAWLVVERMREVGYDKVILYDDRTLTATGVARVMRAEFGHYLPDGNFTFEECGAGEADTAPIAICRAALSAVRASKGEPK